MGALIGRVCFSHEHPDGTLEDFDCTTAPPVLVPPVPTTAPAALHLAPGPLAWVTAPFSTFVVDAPALEAGADQPAVTGQVFAAIGRNLAGDWVQVRNARGDGWLPTASVLLNTPLERLPAVAP